MKFHTAPIICGIALAAMSAAGFSHWWSVRQFVTAFHAGLPVSAAGMPKVAPSTAPAAPAILATVPEPTPAPETSGGAGQSKFYEALIAKIESLQNQNRDLVDQMAETNRDVMKLEFRVDTHSESFRPMPVTEEFRETSFDDGPGVLPPRADPVFLPFDE